MSRRLPLFVGVCVFSVLVSHSPRSFWRHLQYWQPELALLGALLAVASTALLLWARWVLGAMWAGVPLVQEHHELRTGGPYRHRRVAAWDSGFTSGRFRGPYPAPGGTPGLRRVS